MSTPKDRINSTQSWCLELIQTWRRGWDRVLPSNRKKIEESLCYLKEPIQTWIYTRWDRTTSIEATLIIFSRDSKRPDREVLVGLIDESGRLYGDTPRIDWAIGQLEEFWSNMRANWTECRPADSTLKPWQIKKWRDNEDILWMIPGDITGVDIQQLVEFAFREEQLSPKPTTRETKVPHIFNMGMEREQTAVSRWLSLPFAADQLMYQLGLSSFWCGLFLPRKEIFGDSTLDGDVDILGGPLEFDLTKEEWQQNIKKESLNWPLHTPQSFIVSMAIRRAAEEGFICWPPKMNTVVACETKASWFDPATSKWKATHTGEAKGVKGQLQLLLNKGIDRVTFLHIGATKPTDQDIMSPWWQALSNVAAGDNIFPPVYCPKEMPTCGYFTAVLGAVPFAMEDHSGAGGMLRIHQPCSVNLVPNANGWRTQLQNRLAQIPRPTSPTVFITNGTNCGKWEFSGTCPDLL